MAAAISLPSGRMFSAIFGTLERIVGADEPVLKAGTVWLWPAAIDAADFLLEASSTGDLADRLDECVEERGASIFAGASSVGAVDAAPISSDPEAIIRRMRADAESGKKRLAVVLGENPAKCWLEGWNELVTLVGLLLKIDTTSKASGAKSVEQLDEKPRDTGDRPDGNWFEKMIYNAGSGLPLRRAVWQFARGMAALMPIQRAYETSNKLDPWLAHALATTFRDGAKGLLPAIATHDLDPHSPGLHALDPEVLKAWDDAAVASKQTVFAPLADADRG